MAQYFESSAFFAVDFYVDGRFSGTTTFFRFHNAVGSKFLCPRDVRILIYAKNVFNWKHHFSNNARMSSIPYVTANENSQKRFHRKLCYRVSRALTPLILSLNC